MVVRSLFIIGPLKSDKVTHKRILFIRLSNIFAVYL